MNKQGKKMYKFHFIVDNEMKNNLNGITMFKRAGNLSRLITKILMMLAPGIEAKHLNNEQMMSRYEFVNADRKIERKGVFVYLPDYQYRQLKLLHQDLNYYTP
jgi:hypothetical protein